MASLMPNAGCERFEWKGGEGDDVYLCLDGRPVGGVGAIRARSSKPWRADGSHLGEIAGWGWTFHGGNRIVPGNDGPHATAASAQENLLAFACGFYGLGPMSPVA